MPELYDVEFDSFDNFFDKSTIFKNSLLRFDNVDNQFFYAVLYGVLHTKLNGQNVEIEMKVLKNFSVLIYSLN